MVQVVESSELNEVGSYQFVVGCEPTLRDYEPLTLTLSRTRDRGLICASRGLRAGFPLRENDGGVEYQQLATPQPAQTPPQKTHHTHLYAAAGASKFGLRHPRHLAAKTAHSSTRNASA